MMVFLVTKTTLEIRIGKQNKEIPAATRQKTVKNQFTRDMNTCGHKLNDTIENTGYAGKSFY
jgi:hypothetical protein